MTLIEPVDARRTGAATAADHYRRAPWKDIAKNGARHGAPRSTRIESESIIIELVIDPSVEHDFAQPGEERELLALQWRLRGSGMFTQVGVVVSDTDLQTFVAALDRMISGQVAEAVLEGRETPSSVLQLRAGADGHAASMTMLACPSNVPARFVLERLALEESDLMAIRAWAKR